MRLLFAAILFWTAADAEMPPAELRLMFEYRQQLETGAVIATRQTAAGPKRSQRIRFAGDDVSIESLPNESGYLLGQPQPVDADGEPRRIFSLITSGERWEYGLGSPFFARVQRGSDIDGLTRPQCAGLFATRSVGPLNGLEQSLMGAALHYEVSRNANEVIVRGRGESDLIEWRLDPASAHQPTSVRHYRDGKLVAESRTTYANVNGIWCPNRVEFFGDNAAKGPNELIEYSEIEVNESRHPKRLTPSDIGVDPGVNITVIENGEERPEVYFWSGEKIVTGGEFKAPAQYSPKLAAEIAASNERMKQYNVRVVDGRAYFEPIATTGTGHAAAHSAGPLNPPTSAPARPESDWERYTREYIARYKLNEEQSQSAWRILKDCQDKANRYLSRNHDAITDLQRKIDEAAAATTSAPANRAAEMLDTLMEPVQQIFNKQLLPRLERLPTRAQREAAGV